MLGLCGCSGLFSSCGEGGLLLAVVSRVVQDSTARGLGRCGSRAPEHRLNSCAAVGLNRSAARGIFPDQGSNPCLLPWEADSSPLSRQGGPAHPFSVLKTDTGLTQKSARWVEIRGVKSSR